MGYGRTATIVSERWDYPAKVLVFVLVRQWCMSVMADLALLPTLRQDSLPIAGMFLCEKRWPRIIRASFSIKCKWWPVWWLSSGHIPSLPAAAGARCGSSGQSTPPLTLLRPALFANVSPRSLRPFVTAQHLCHRSHHAVVFVIFALTLPRWCHGHH